MKNGMAISEYESEAAYISCGTRVGGSLPTTIIDIKAEKPRLTAIGTFITRNITNVIKIIGTICDIKSTPFN